MDINFSSEFPSLDATISPTVEFSCNYVEISTLFIIRVSYIFDTSHIIFTLNLTQSTLLSHIAKFCLDERLSFSNRPSVPKNVNF